MQIPLIFYELARSISIPAVDNFVADMVSTPVAIAIGILALLVTGITALLSWFGIMPPIRGVGGFNSPVYPAAMSLIFLGLVWMVATSILESLMLGNPINPVYWLGYMNLAIGVVSMLFGLCLPIFSKFPNWLLPPSLRGNPKYATKASVKKYRLKHKDQGVNGSK